MKREKQGRYPAVQRERKHAESPADAATLLQAMAEQAPPASGLDGLEAACRACIEAHGLPGDDRRIAARQSAEAPSGIEWTEYADAPSGWTAYRGVRALAAGAHPLIEIDSDIGYACRVLDAVLRAREAQAVPQALDYAAEAGALAAESDMLREYLAEKAGGNRANETYNKMCELCQEEAERQWAADHDHEIRIGMMINHCQRMLDRMGFENLPTENTIRRNIRRFAPAYARQGGRPRKR